MRVFNRVKSDHITFLTRIINDMTAEEAGTDIENLREKISKYFNSNPEYTDELYDCLFEKTGLFTSDNGTVSFRPLEVKEDYAEVLSGIPPILTKIEKRYLKTIMKDPLFRSLVGDKLFSTLEEKLKDTESETSDDTESGKMKDTDPYDWKSHFTFRPGNLDDRIYDHDKELSDKIAELVQLIRNKRMISYVNNTKDRKIFGTAYPYRIMYTQRNDLFQLLIYLPEPEDDRVILANIIFLDNITDAGKAPGDMEQRAKNALLKRKQTENPLVLEVEEIYGSVERCFNLFISYEKKAEYNAKTRKYTLTVQYYDFDEEDIIRSILSLGDAVEVKSPECIRNKVIGKIRKAAAYYNDREDAK